MKFCTIGCGGHASHSHGPSQRLYALRHPDVELAACCDLNSKFAEDYRLAFGFQRAYTNIDEMLKVERPDAVALVVPAAATCALAAPLLKSGVALLLEKPPGLTLAEYESLVAAAQLGGGLNQVAFNRRYAPAMTCAYRWLEQWVPADEVFHIRYNLVRHARNESDFSTTAVHALDAVRFLARSPYEEVSFTYRELPQCGPGVVSFSMQGHCANGTEVSLNVQPMSGLLSETVDIHALDQNVQIDLLGTNSAFDGGVKYWRGGSLRESYEVSDRELVERNGVYHETRAFLDAVAQGLPPKPQLQDCRQQVILMEAVRTRTATVRFDSTSRGASGRTLAYASAQRDVCSI